MDSHKRILGILYIVTGILQILVFTVISAIFATLFPFIIDEADPDARWILEWVSHFGQMLGYVLIFVFAVPSVIAGIGLLSKKSWALTLALIMGCFKLFSFPIGTIIGIYTIWVFAEEQRQNKTT